jgi:hypothetical protein
LTAPPEGFAALVEMIRRARLDDELRIKIVRAGRRGSRILGDEPELNQSKADAAGSWRPGVHAEHVVMWVLQQWQYVRHRRLGHWTSPSRG